MLVVSLATFSISEFFVSFMTLPCGGEQSGVSSNGGGIDEK